MPTTPQDTSTSPVQAGDAPDGFHRRGCSLADAGWNRPKPVQAAADTVDTVEGRLEQLAVTVFDLFNYLTPGVQEPARAQVRRALDEVAAILAQHQRETNADTAVMLEAANKLDQPHLVRDLCERLADQEINQVHAYSAIARLLSIGIVGAPAAEALAAIGYLRRSLGDTTCDRLDREVGR